MRYEKLQKDHWTHKDATGCTDQLTEEAVLKVERKESKLEKHAKVVTNDKVHSKEDVVGKEGVAK